MRPVRKITAEEENFRIEKSDPFELIHRDPVQPEPIGTIVLMAFRIVGYDSDCDGSLMARLEQIDREGRETGWDPTNIGLYPNTDLVVSADELQRMFAETPSPAAGSDGGETATKHNGEKPMKYAFCESTNAGGDLPWHIRGLSDAGPKFGGGIDTVSLCGRAGPVGSGAGGWDIEARITNDRLDCPRHTCPDCVRLYREATTPVAGLGTDT